MILEPSTVGSVIAVSMFAAPAVAHHSFEQMRVTERFTHTSFGHMQVEITVNDPGAYTKPWSVKQTFHFLPDTELIEHICEENNKAPEEIHGKPPE